ncbi:GD17541 [Drosophila simulans]|uniref:GD17541 n=1 Tax=Drosophila simulans TaxID=7240 RepID=B4R3T6_DROSI|nr:GD17541 [Drosophila simulans]
MLGKRTGSRHIAVVLLMCLFWYVISSSNNVIGKMVLNEFPFPMTVTLVQLCSITLYSGPFFNLWRIRKYQDIPRPYYYRLIVPLALGKLLASVTSHISLWKVPVSYAHTGESSARRSSGSPTRQQNLCDVLGRKFPSGKM